jgi:c-di-GMP-binding flagellar brake protein YcgR
MAPNNSEQQAERVTAKPRIIGLLQRLKEARTLLLVHLPEDNNRYTSAVLEVDLQHGQVVLDELTPAEGNTRVEKTRRLHVTGRLAGAQVRFRGDVHKIETGADAIRYVLTLPEYITHEQRRNAFRVRIPLGQSYPVVLVCEGQGSYEGELYDISNTGLGLYVAPGTPVATDDGHRYVCRIRIPQGGELSAEIELRFVSLDQRGHHLQVGGRFINLLGPQRNAMERFVMQLQREIIRRSRGV